jgi:hypothetical protein
MAAKQALVDNFSRQSGDLRSQSLAALAASVNRSQAIRA